MNVILFLVQSYQHCRLRDNLMLLIENKREPAFAPIHWNIDVVVNM
jgi:hypothetical protein